MESRQVRNAPFTSSHPGVKPPRQVQGRRSQVRRLEARSPGKSDTRTAVCQRANCEDPQCPARDLHNLSDIVELLKKPIVPRSGTSPGLAYVLPGVHLDNAHGTRAHGLLGGTERTQATQRKRDPRRKLVKKTPHKQSLGVIKEPLCREASELSTNSKRHGFVVPEPKKSLPCHSTSPRLTAGGLDDDILDGPWFTNISGLQELAATSAVPMSRYAMRNSSGLTGSFVDDPMHISKHFSQAKLYQIDEQDSVRSMSSEAVGNTLFARKLGGAIARPVISSQPSFASILSAQGHLNGPLSSNPVQRSPWQFDLPARRSHEGISVDRSNRASSNLIIHRLDATGHRAISAPLPAFNTDDVFSVPYPPRKQMSLSALEACSSRVSVGGTIYSQAFQIPIAKGFKHSIRIVDTTPTPTPTKKGSISQRRSRLVERKLRDLHATSQISPSTGVANVASSAELQKDALHNLEQAEGELHGSSDQKGMSLYTQSDSNGHCNTSTQPHLPGITTSSALRMGTAPSITISHAPTIPDKAESTPTPAQPDSMDFLDNRKTITPTATTSPDQLRPSPLFATRSVSPIRNKTQPPGLQQPQSRVTKTLPPLPAPGKSLSLPTLAVTTTATTKHPAVPQAVSGATSSDDSNNNNNNNNNIRDNIALSSSAAPQPEMTGNTKRKHSQEAEAQQSRAIDTASATGHRRTRDKYHVHRSLATVEARLDVLAAEVQRQRAGETAVQCCHHQQHYHQRHCCCSGCYTGKSDARELHRRRPGRRLVCF